MAGSRLAVAFCLLVASSHVTVTSFSIGKRVTRSADLADALSILQRQRRRIGSDGYFGSERLLSNRPLDIDDISEWLSTRAGPSDQDGWTSDPDNFDELDPRERAMYDFSPLTFDPDQAGNTAFELEPTRQELSDIFQKDENEDEELNDIFSENETPSIEIRKKNKEEPIDVAGSKKVDDKKYETNSNSDDVSLDSLTQEELKVLMKAVQKIHNQQDKRSQGNVEVKETIEHETPFGKDIVTNVDEVPAEVEELESVFGKSDPHPFAAEAKTVDTEEIFTPQGKITKTIEKDILPDPEEDENMLELENNLLANIEEEEQEEEEEEKEAQAAEEAIKMIELEEEKQRAENDNDEDPEIANQALLDPQVMEALGEKYWLMNNYLDKSTPSKRTAKRSVFIPDDAFSDPPSEGIVSLNDDNTEDSEVLAKLRSGSLPSVKAFVEKILELQDELDQLRAITRLEDIENDELTDALNEATLAQGRGSVSSVEFNALQQAIKIEEAIQNLKSREKMQNKSPPMKKSLADQLGKSWRRKRDPQRDVRRSSASERPSKVYALEPVKRKAAPTLDKSDLGQLLAEAYVLQHGGAGEDEGDDEEDREDDEDAPRENVASLFLPDPDQCPAVRIYSTNCELADFYSLPVDDEARALCNLHEMCYACGHSLSVPQDYCDSIYRDAANTLCMGARTCERQAEVFLRTMKLKTRYVPHKQPACRAACTATFLGLH